MHLIAGNDPDNQVKEISVDSEGNLNAQLVTLGKDLTPEPVSNGFGIGVRQHDDVMLAYGYSRFTRYEISVPVGDFLVLRLDVNDASFHHAELRTVGTSAASLRLKTYIATGNENLFPANPITLPKFNQIGLIEEVTGLDVKAGLFAYPINQTNPFSALTAADNVSLYTAPGGGPIDPSPDNFPSVKGRHYLPNETYALVIENIGSEVSVVYYQYDWHEY